MAHDVAQSQRQESDSALRQWGVVTALVACLVGVPALVLAEVEAGLLSALGLGSGPPFALLVMVPGFALGALSLVVMLGTP